MKQFKQAVGRFLRDEGGTEAMEWGLVCGLVVVGAIVALTFIGPKVNDMWNSTKDAVKDASAAAPQQ